MTSDARNRAKQLTPVVRGRKFSKALLLAAASSMAVVSATSVNAVDMRGGGAIAALHNYTYTFTLKTFKITDTRSLHNDTDFVTVAVAVGGKAPITLPVKSMGNVNNGTYTVDLTIPSGDVSTNEGVAFSYSIVNTGFMNNTLEQDLIKAIGAAVAKGAAAGGKAGGTALAGPVGGAAGSGIGSAAGTWLWGKVGQYIFPNCDGSVAAGVHTYTGGSLWQIAGTNGLTLTDDNKGTDSPKGCGRNSRYYVTWSVTGHETPLMNHQ